MMANATITQNLLNCLNAYNLPYPHYGPSDLPTVFSNDPEAGGKRNVLTMSVGQNNNNIYSRVPNPQSQKMLQLGKDGQPVDNSSNSDYYATVYNYDLSSTRINNTMFGGSLLTPYQMSRMTGVINLFGDTSNTGVVPMLCDGTDEITLETTDVSGNIVLTSNSVLSTTYNEDGSYTVVYRCTLPSNVATFTLKSVLFSFRPNNYSTSSASKDVFDVDDLPPIIYWGLVLDAPIELEANDSVKVSVTYHTNFIA